MRAAAFDVRTLRGGFCGASGICQVDFKLTARGTRLVAYGSEWRAALPHQNLRRVTVDGGRAAGRGLHFSVHAFSIGCIHYADGNKVVIVGPRLLLCDLRANRLDARALCGRKRRHHRAHARRRAAHSRCAVTGRLAYHG